MARRIVTLKASAMESARFRGHVMQRFVTDGDNRDPKDRNWRATSTCRDCDAWVQVNTRPMPNDTDISGTAVAINCGDKL